ncbi:NAD(P)H-dependent oxidoreductase [Kordiimonas sp.]|uniref:NAD(P)H-dependent oxidoreductase n=1 Tax=Kordiimonas sp. TaxID=1970157 RepID=UPI003B51568B
MKRILALYAHPSPRSSYLNAYLMQRLSALPNVVVRDLYHLYPNFYIDTAAEQEHLLNSDIVLMQFPVRWFNVPSIIREWQDSVLTPGFAFGKGGTALAGKEFMITASTGGDVTSYAEDQPHGAHIDTYLTPLKQTATFCGMKILPSFIVHAARGLNTSERAKIADKYIDQLTALTRERE